MDSTRGDGEAKKAASDPLGRTSNALAKINNLVNLETLVAGLETLEAARDLVQ